MSTPSEILATTSATAPAGAAQAAWQQARARWQALAPRERVGVGAAAAVLGAYLFWALALAPAWRTVRQVPVQIAQADDELRQLRRLAGEAGALRATTPIAADQSLAALRGATARLAGATLGPPQGDRLSVTLAGVEPTALAAWLGEVRGAARARVVEAQLTRRGTTYDGSVALQLPRAP